ncbi:hypothetical protein JJB09_04750 [Rhizobium sp. KVB221]|uniref:Uncharacterized protein n=1 Tax=Rhizobium setariae TaxID=2801340 RepID=A0A936YNE4_9HYPH|nr:hypothetical protein [Rhizobium setariae]MBL0371329.1 hypothetical protein [Rhizobium setariae]
MNSLLKTSLLATIVISSFVSPGFAAGISATGGHPQVTEAKHGTPANLVSFDASATRRAEQLIAHWKGTPFQVQQIGQIEDDLSRETLQDRQRSEPNQVADLQAAIRHNHPLLQKLRNENVEINNIVGADAAMDGQLTLYVE